MSKTENAKKSRGKRTPSAEERLKDAIASCEERHRHWHELYANGTRKRTESCTPTAFLLRLT